MWMNFEKKKSVFVNSLVQHRKPRSQSWSALDKNSISNVEKPLETRDAKKRLLQECDDGNTKLDADGRRSSRCEVRRGYSKLKGIGIQKKEQI